MGAHNLAKTDQPKSRWQRFLDNDIVYGGSYGGFLTRVNHKNNSVRGINVWPNNPMGYGAEGMKYRFQWNFPIHFSKHNQKKLYTFSNHVHVSEN